MVTMTDNTVSIQLKSAKKVELKCSPQKKKKKLICGGWIHT